MNATGYAAVPTWMIRDHSIPRSAVLVYAALSSRGGLGEICPSQATLADEAGISERTVRRMLKSLEELGVVQRHERRGGEGRATKLPDGYTLHPNGSKKLADNLAGSSKLAAKKSEATGQELQAILPIEVTSEVARAKPAKTKPHPLPADWKPTPEHRAFAAERGVDVDTEAEAFRAHAEAHAREAVVWNAAFRQWLIKARPSKPSEIPKQEWPAGFEWMEFNR
jgi:DNA-binding transcriptional regulator YhcF (GntR family)